LGRCYFIIMIFTLSVGIGCQLMKRAHESNDDDYTKVTFRVDGMMKAKSGAT